MSEPVICFGQQPCGFFPKRFLVAKILTARRLQEEIGGRIVFFCHDSDHDPRETATKLADTNNGRIDCLNFSFANKWQKKYSPLFAKRVDREWQSQTARQLPKYVSGRWVELFASITADNVADFCTEMYRGMGLLDGVEIKRSGDPEFRRQAAPQADYFVDTFWQGELVRARKRVQSFVLHQGGDSYLEIPVEAYGPERVSPTRDTRLPWMQSVIHCTHYVAGASEIEYLDTSLAPEIEFVTRDSIERSDEAFIDSND